MVNEILYKVVFGVMVVMLISAIGYANSKAQKEHGSRFAQAANEVPIILWIRGLIGIPMWVVLVAWLVSANWIRWTILPLPQWTRLVGVGLAALVSVLFWWIHLSLGSNYRGTNGLHDNHQLVTTGPYQYVRHPTYVAFPLTMVVLFLLSSNWLLGIAGFALTVTIGVGRVPVEERQLHERFGQAYKDYASRTGRFVPRIGSGRRS